METRFLGKTGVRVSRLCMGTMSFGGDADESMSASLFGRCRDAGINFFDTADVYGDGRSEEILGSLLRGCRDEVVVASKAYFPTGPGPNERGSSRLYLRRAVDASLRRLQTDRIDLFYLHRFDEHTSAEETLRGLEDLVRAGKILYPALSNFAAWQATKLALLARSGGQTPIVALQPMYNLVKRQAEAEILPMCASEGLAVFPYSPTAGGLLSGKYTRHRRPEHGRLVERPLYRARYGAEENFAAAEAFTELAARRGVHPVTLAVAWVASHPAVTSPIIGARNLEQLEPALAALELDLGESRAEISALTSAPPPATDRSEEGGAHTLDRR